jgi:DNA helicase-2/ATP-dependent DNA helicase PcrA
VVLELIRLVDFKDYYCSKNLPEDIDRWENIQELVNSVQEFCTNSSNPNLQSFLEEVSLLTDIDRWNNNDKYLTLMTVHSSKGLEFPLVFIAGMEEGLFPHSNSMNDDESIEEERRLFYVAVTRAMEELYLFSADSRMKFGGGNLPTLRSRFVDEIPKELLDFKNKVNDDGFGSISKNYYNKVSMFIKKGNLVNHQLYGSGKVLNVEGTGDNTKVTVLFSGNIRKKFIQRYANLKVIS